MKKKVDNKKTVSNKKETGKAGRGKKNVTSKLEGNFDGEVFKVIMEEPTKLTIRKVQSKKSPKKIVKIRKNTNTVSPKSQPKSKKAATAEKSHSTIAAEAVKSSHSKRAKSQKNRKTQLKKIPKIQAKKKKAPISQAAKKKKIMKARMMAVLRQAKLIKKMNVKAIERANKPINKNSRKLLYKARKHLSNSESVHKSESVNDVDKSVAHRFSLFAKNRIYNMTSLDLTPYHNVFKNLGVLKHLGEKRDHPFVSTDSRSISNFIMDMHLGVLKQLGEKGNHPFVSKESETISNFITEMLNYQKLANLCQLLSQQKEEDDQVAFSKLCSKVFNVSPENFLKCMLSDDKRIVVSELSEDTLRSISSSCFSLFCQVMNNSISKMHRSFRTKLMIKDFKRAGPDLRH